MRRVRFIRVLCLLLFSVFAVQLTTAPPALAADHVPASMTPDQWKRFQKLEPGKKLEIRDAIIAENAKERCGDPLFYTMLLKGTGCEDLVKKGFTLVWPTAEHALGIEKIPIGICPALRQVGMNTAAYTQCLANSVITGLQFAGGPLIKVALQQSPGGRLVLGLAEGGVTAVKFIADPQTELEKMANTAKAESVSSTQKVLEQITAVSTFDAGDEGFRTMWATFAGVGLVLMGVMLFALHQSYGRGEMSDDTYQNALMYYAPGGAILSIWGPPLLHQLGNWSSGLAEGTGAFAGSQVTDFIAVIARFGALESTAWFGPLIALLFFGLLLLGSWGVLIYLAMVPFLQASAALALALLVGMFIHPRTKPYALKIGFTVLGLMFLKPVLYLLMGGVFWILAHQEVLTSEADNVLSTAVSLAVTALVLIAVLFAPAAVFRLIPAMPASDFQFGGGPNVAGAAVAAGAGAAVSRSIAAKRGGGASSGRSGAWNASGSSGGSAGPDSSGPGTGGGFNGSGGVPPGSSGASPGAAIKAGQSAERGRNSLMKTKNRGSDSQATPPAEGGSSLGGRNGSPPNQPGTSDSSTAPRVPRTVPNGPGGAMAGPTGGPAPRAESGPADSGPKPRSTRRVLGEAAGAVAKASVAPLKAGAVGALYAGREGARRAREASDVMIPKHWGE